MEDTSLSSLNNEQIVNYIFSNLNPDEEKAVDDFLSKNKEYAFAIQGIFKYCEDTQSTKEELLKYLNEQNFYQVLTTPLHGEISTVKKLPIARLSMAASIIFIVSSGILSFLFLQKKGENTHLYSEINLLHDSLHVYASNLSQIQNAGDEVQKKDSLLRAANLLAKANLPNPGMEKRRDQFLTERAAGTTIISPKPEQQFNLKESIIFRWESSHTPIVLKIIDNKGNTIFQKSNPVAPVAPPTLHPGLYYWTLESERDMLYMDRLIVLPQ